MSLPDSFRGRLRLPIVASPMFLVSGHELVIAQCKAGIIGSFPSLNARPEAELQVWLSTIQEALAAHDASHPRAPAAPYAVNLISNKSNARFEHDAAVCVENKVPLLLTSLSPPGDLVRAVHGYDGLVFHDVTTVRHAEKALEQGVDGLILVCNGAGGHAGTANPFAFYSEVRRFYDGIIVLAGAIGTGGSIHAALSLGADMVYIGSRFIPAQESRAPDDYREMIVEASLKDVVYTPFFSGLPANYLRQSIVASGLDPEEVASANKDKSRYQAGARTSAKAWRDIRGAGQGIGLIERVQSLAEIADQLEREWVEARVADDAARAARAAWLRQGGY
ncbi:nitronate monooxygenase family protein [Methylocella sp. CPCC 101449]|uniref:NAD(P)H-dependent flavin oxidoreductase n=1 Tax=Methylocella sp. CPCC 101449 TaxID=2987531 RepID=UPI00289212FD|nr:nitronate monooxygenase family protein [Methylocella sp. CPCC 101449]MDT2023100.1 nitronate monooxygenase family protein [Methylocella sp. CPCC 101449]